MVARYSKDPGTAMVWLALIPFFGLILAFSFARMNNQPPVLEYLERKIMNGKDAEASREIEDYLRRDEDYHWAYAARSLIKAKQGNFVAAANDIKMSVRLRKSVTWVGNRRRRGHDHSKHLEFPMPKSCTDVVDASALSDRPKNILKSMICVGALYKS